MNALTAVVIILGTVGIYLVVSMVYRRFRLPVLMPALTATLVVVVALLYFDIPYDTYMIGGKWINQLLGPAVVSLAYPLYRQRHTLRRNLPAVLGGTLVGLLVGMLSGVFLGLLLGFPKDYIVSLLPKSITTPVAIQISASLGGEAALTSVFVMVAGFTGAIAGPYILKLLRVRGAVGIGIGLGTASHALGTAKALEYGDEAVSMSSVAMTVCAIAGSVASPLVVWLLY